MRSELERLIDEYHDRFGEPYPLVITDNRAEAVERIKECLRTGRKAPEPEYEEGVDY